MCHCLYGCVTLGWKPKCGSDVEAIIAHYIQAALETLLNLVRIMEDTVCKLTALDLGRADARKDGLFHIFNHPFGVANIKGLTKAGKTGLFLSRQVQVPAASQNRTDFMWAAELFRRSERAFPVWGWCYYQRAQ